MLFGGIVAHDCGSILFDMSFRLYKTLWIPVVDSLRVIERCL